MADENAPHPGEEKALPIAVALKHDRWNDRAPTVIASGQGAVAEQILEIAFAEGVKVREDPDLVQLLALVDVDSEIPLEAFAAVAEILAYVYRANGDSPPLSGLKPGTAPPLTETLDP
ncbi:EscU/YscU/HrcU family type III secretion system export apparatus switch protein [Magnetospira sp. QH-2]|uniref:EscU/YscU/HrcU family type III secretion system export apparatus switch protein n=1 Tax=Magnetospira sp. (strain QH-2) TaxID=1288970 RepID=UPI0005FA58CE|nr:EscU/YscU/HrcU family type III secretion system export apparatus switch protein [Magnetospira sp. QH-2]